MNLELPFPEHEVALDEYVEAMDEALEPLFLDAVDAELKRLREERAATAAAAGEAA